MKNIYFLLLTFLFAGTQLSAQVVWDNFEDSRKGYYGFIHGTFIPYSANPDMSGVNTSPVAAQYFRNPVEMFDVIVIETDNALEDLADYLSGAKTLGIDVWAPGSGRTVQITLEDKSLSEGADFPIGRHSVYLATTGTSMAWESLTFAFDNQPDPSVANTDVDRIVLLFDPGMNNGDEWRFDNLITPAIANDPCGGVSPDANVFNDFECNQSAYFTFSHSGINFRRVKNPDQTGANTSDMVATYTRNGGEENDVIVGSFGNGINLSSNSTISIDVWDPAAPTPINIALQQGGVDVANVAATTSASSQWQTLTYDFSAAVGQDVDGFVILFDPGTFSSDKYYWDNFRLANGTATFEEISGLSDFVAFPNPAHSEANFQYELQNSAAVTLTVSDLTGRIVETVADENQNAGNQYLRWDTSEVPNGIYFYTLSVNGKLATGKITVAK